MPLFEIFWLVIRKPDHVISFRLMVGQVTQQPAERHFRFSGLEAALHRGLGSLLGIGVAHALGEEIGIAAEVQIPQSVLFRRAPDARTARRFIHQPGLTLEGSGTPGG